VFIRCGPKTCRTLCTIPSSPIANSWGPQPVPRLVDVVEVGLCPPIPMRAVETLLDVDIIRAANVPLVLDSGSRDQALAVVDLVPHILLETFWVE
jgi:hypothetical protein